MSFSRPVTRSSRQFDIVASVGQTVFTFPAPLFDPADLLVMVQVAGPLGGFLLSDPSQYAIALTPTLANATVTFATAPRLTAAAIVTVRLSGQRTQDRLTDVTRGGTFSAVAYENELDRQTIVLQELRRDISAAVQAVQAALANPLLPVSVARRSAFFLALEALQPGATQDLATALPGNPADPLTLAWRDAAIAPGSPIAVWVQARYAFSDSQMATLFATVPTILLVRSTAVRRSVWLQALEALAPGAVQDLATSMPGDPANAVTLAWEDGTVDPMSPLVPYVMARYGLSGQHMAALFVTAAFS